MYWTTNPTLNNFNRMLDEMNRLWGNGHQATDGAFPKVNAYTNDDGMVLTAELPGVDPKDVELTIKENTVTISGNLPQRASGESERYHRNERRHGNFSRQFTLPFRVDAEKVKAASTHGVLTLTLPKVEEEKPRKITVNVA